MQDFRCRRPYSYISNLENQLLQSQETIPVFLVRLSSLRWREGFLATMQIPFDQREELFSTTVTSSVTPSTQSPSPRPNRSGNARDKRLVLPVVQENDYSLQLIDPAKERDLRSYMIDDLDVDRLNKIHKHLWFAGLPRCARPLHHQLMIDRKIMITERADLHLLWRRDRLYLKPMPDYLLSHGIWEGTLLKDEILFENAKGFLLSYLWLIRQKSDFVIAQRENLVSNDLTWEHWTTFSTAIFPNVVSDSFEGTSPRYLYGELRLARVNLVYRLCRNTRSFKTFIRGYFYGYHTYANFIQQNFAWVLTVIVYITIVLTAMQVGLATTGLQNSQGFNQASYGFTIFSIVAPLAILLGMLLVLLILIFFNLNYAVRQRSTTRRSFPAVFDNIALRSHSH